MARRYGWVTLLAALAGAPGCANDGARTQARPAGRGSSADIAPPSDRLRVRALQPATSPVRQQVVLVASVTDPDGGPQKGQRVEWMLEGAGAILEVDEGGL